MAKTAILSIRIEPRTKSQAEKIFKKLGITMTEAVNMLFRQTINDNALPFRPHIGEIPNAETIAAMKEGDQMLAEIASGKRKPRYKSTKKMFADLGMEK